MNKTLPKSLKLSSDATSVLLTPALAGAFPAKSVLAQQNHKGGNMKSTVLTCITTMTLLSALAIPLRLAAQTALGLKYTVLYTFTGETDGKSPELGSLIQDQSGNLYGTTIGGGDLSACGGSGCGVVFKVDPTGNETVLYSFMGSTDGANPQEGLCGTRRVTSTARAAERARLAERCSSWTRTTTTLSSIASSAGRTGTLP